MKLRDYQDNTKKTIIEKFKKFNFLVCGMFMGGGKSIIISEITKYYSKNKNIVILVNISELIPQLISYFTYYNIDFQVLKSGYEIDTKQTKVWIVMEQSYYKDKRNIVPIKCDILIKDEFHIGYSIDKKTSRYNSLINYFNPDKILGLTGTPFDKSGYLLEGLNKDNLILYGNAKELTDKGYLVPLKYFVPKWSETINYKDVKQSAGDYSTKDLDKKINTISHIKLIVKSMLEMNSKNKKTLVYCNSIQNSEDINKELVKSGFKSVAVHSKKDSKENSKNIKNFNLDFKDKNSIDCLVSVSKLTTGYNEPKASLLVLCRPTKILNLYLQILFRVARPYPGKKYAEILDLSQCISEHGFGTEPRLLIKPYNTKGLKKEKERVKKSIINVINDKPTEIDINKLKLKIKELKIRDLNLNNNSITSLIRIFNIENNLPELIYIAFELRKRIKQIDYTENLVKNVIKEEQLKLSTSKNKNLYISKYKDYLKLFIKNQQENP